MDGPELWRELGQQLRVDAVRASAKAGSGHPTSSMSAADLAAVLLASHFRYDIDEPKSPANDRLVFSKGHASPLVYGLFRAAGALSEEEFGTYRQFGSRLEGHPTPSLPWVDVATGSLGQGLPIGVGMALAGKRLDRLPFRVWVICGDSEMAEGSMWEAAEHAAFYELDNLTAIVDVNRLGQRGETMHGWDLSSYSDRLGAFGWHAIEIDGHDVEQIDAAYREAESTTGKPTAIVAKTLKGKGYSKVEDQGGWHGKAVAEEAVEQLGGVRNITVDVPKPEPAKRHRFDAPGSPEWPRYEVGSKVATRKAYGEALAALGGTDPMVVALDGEVSNSTYAEIFAGAHPDRYFEMYIAEQQMAAAAVGIQVLGWKPFASTFAAFWSRAYDFVRMAAISRANLKLCGSHAGVSIGEDGPSQMALEDLAEFRAINGSTVLYPSDGNQTARLVRHEALSAADRLAEEDVAARVIDLYSVKPIDAETIRAIRTPIVTAEDHWAEGGLGEAVLAALADVEDRPPVQILAVRELPHSGKPAELLAAAGIDAEAIAAAARALVRARVSA
ncbi:MAG: tktA2 [Gaiellaceae bacterium]|nr:tktA2 [Gaiellaceae bacterium]